MQLAHKSLCQMEYLYALSIRQHKRLKPVLFFRGDVNNNPPSRSFQYDHKEVDRYIAILLFDRCTELIFGDFS